jgi:hypothetical protein
MYLIHYSIHIPPQPLEPVLLPVGVIVRHRAMPISRPTNPQGLDSNVKMCEMKKTRNHLSICANPCCPMFQAICNKGRRNLVSSDLAVLCAVEVENWAHGIGSSGIGRWK